MTIRMFRRFLIGLLCLLAASASFHGYYSRWGMNEDCKYLGLQVMFDGQAPRPWAYRQLLPAVATAITDAMPAQMRTELTAKLREPAQRLHHAAYRPEGWSAWCQSDTYAPLALNPNYTIRYYIVYYIAFLALVVATPVMIAVCRKQAISLMASIMGSVLFVLLFPILEDIVGYYYDTTEILFIFAYILLILERKLCFLCIPLAIVATINKESFLFFIITTIPLCLEFRRGLRELAFDRRGLIVTASSATVAAVIHAAMMPLFASNPGSETMHWFRSNVRFYANPLSLFESQEVYGVVLFAGYSIVTLTLLIGVLKIGLPRLDSRINAYTAAAILVNLPLFILFCYHGEVRNLSFLYPPTLLALSATLDRLLGPYGATAPITQPQIP